MGWVRPLREQKVNEQPSPPSTCKPRSALLCAVRRGLPPAPLLRVDLRQRAPLPHASQLIPDHPRTVGTRSLSLIKRLNLMAGFLSCPSRAELLQGGPAPAYLRGQKINFSVMSQTRRSLCCQQQPENRDMGACGQLTSCSSA